MLNLINLKNNTIAYNKYSIKRIVIICCIYLNINIQYMEILLRGLRLLIHAETIANNAKLRQMGGGSMNANHRDLINIFFTLAVVLLTAFVAHRFIVPLVWAGIIAIATWPVYKKVEHWCGRRELLSASILTLLFTIVVIMPLFWLMLILVQETQHFVTYLIQLNTHGMPTPGWINNTPAIGQYLADVWQHTLAKPQGISEFISNSHGSIKPVSVILKSIGSKVAHRFVLFGFSVICLFFFYRDGQKLAKQIDILGQYCLKDRWALYAHQLPKAIMATVNGLVLVGIAVGVIMGICYGFAGVPFPALLGGATAVLAMIPFGAPIIFIIVSLILVAKGSIVWAIITIALGIIVMFIADHFVRPTIIGSATKLHFLAVFFGILGGVETFGLVGLFIGPVVMVLFSTLWREPIALQTSA